MSTGKIKRIACMGEVMAELFVTGQGSAALNVAGDSYNTAVYLARLLQGQDVDVSYVTALGQDSFSERAMAQMAAEGIGTDQVARHPTRTIGLYAIETDEAGERSFTYWRNESAARTMFGEPDALPDLSGFDLVFLSGITLAILPPESRARLMTALDQFRTQGGLVGYDSNHRPKLWESVEIAQEQNARMWARTDIALPSVDDEMLIYGETTEAEVLARLKGHGLARGALKRGPLGPLGLSGQGEPPRFEPITKVVDTTAAGDSFNAGFLSQIALGQDEAQALQVGHGIASQVIQAKGAIVPVALP